jgi:hypothetical protein
VLTWSTGRQRTRVFSLACTIYDTLARTRVAMFRVDASRYRYNELFFGAEHVPHYGFAFVSAGYLDVLNLRHEKPTVSHVLPQRLPALERRGIPENQLAPLKGVV